jgi:hypothetical protein
VFANMTDDSGKAAGAPYLRIERLNKHFVRLPLEGYFLVSSRGIRLLPRPVGVR